MSPRGGRRPGSGARPRGDEPMPEIVRASVTAAQLWWVDHLADHAGLSRSEWIRSLIDRAAGEHRCEQCETAADTAKKASK